MCRRGDLHNSVNMSNLPVPGNFDGLNIPSSERNAIESAYQAVSSVQGGWEHMKTFDPGEGGFFLNPATGKQKEIEEAVLKNYGGHSGASYACTMRVIQFIGRYGWNRYAQEMLDKYGPPHKKSELETFLENTEKNENLRRLMPDIDQQISDMRRFVKAVQDAEKDPSTWKQSNGFPYPCSCHRAQGKEGWCGVAGFGVPGCEH